jgi:hypothetical protein
MIMTSGIMNTTQSKNITTPQNNLESPSISMHRVQQRQSRVPIYTNCEGDDVNLRGDDDVAVDDEDATFTHAKGVPVTMTVSNSPQRQPQNRRICPLSEKKRTIASSAILENYVKFSACVFP